MGGSQGFTFSRIADRLRRFGSERTPLDQIRSTISLLRPMDVGLPLIRIGRDFDGGYLVPDDLGGISACFSPGVDTHASFEQDLARRGIACHLADHSVDGPPAGCEDMSFEKRFLGSYESDTHTTLGSWVDRHTATETGDLLLQMDIEGAEYDVLPGIDPALLKRFRILVVEFHKFDWLAQPFVHRRIRACLEKLARDFVPVHVHPNNNTFLRRIGPLRVPRIIEVTYLRKDRCRALVPQTMIPHPLDRKNVPTNPTVDLPEEWYRPSWPSARPVGMPIASRRPFDVITVPDFSPRGRPVFEARTIVFLASWLEHAGAARNYPLHLACIGEPPKSVRRLADACNARITVHEPLKLRNDHHVGNKLRGLEIEPETDRFLLLDVDVAILSDVSPLSDLGDCVAACPDDAPNVPCEDWTRIHEAFGMPMPQPIRPLVCELDLPRYPRAMMGYEAGDAQVEWMLPYYNGGVVFAPWASGLRDVWEANIVRIAGEFEEQSTTRKWIHQSDQAALAVTIGMLDRAGTPFRRLPDAFNARWQHLYAGSPDVGEIAILHCCWNFLNSIGDGPVDADTIAEALDRFFLGKVRHRFQKLVFGDLLRMRPVFAGRRYREGIEHAKAICLGLQAACRRHLERPREQAVAGPHSRAA